MLIQTFSALSLTLATLVSSAPCLETATTAGGGVPPAGILPAEISDFGIKNIQLTQFLENLEVSFFSAGSANISEWGADGFANSSIDTVIRVAAQEEIHLETLSTILNAYEVPNIPPCNYSFPVSSTKEFFQAADLLESVGISAVIGLSQRLAVTDPSLASLVSSIITIEARHDAFFRGTQGKLPNPSPFDTGISDIWAYNLALSFIVPGSCPVELPIPVLPRLTVAQATTAPYANKTANSTALQEFTWDSTQLPYVVEGDKQLFAGWVNQVGMPVYTPLTMTTSGKGTARIPDGLSGIVYVGVTTEQYTSANDLALGTIAGPAITIVS